MAFGKVGSFGGHQATVSTVTSLPLPSPPYPSPSHFVLPDFKGSSAMLLRGSPALGTSWYNTDFRSKEQKSRSESVQRQ